MRYRPEIDGLRSLAILPVIFYHAGFSLFRGGFVGVDIFFVISGYLITGILLTDLTNGEFSLLRFYERRIRRILPALLVVLLLTITVSGFYLLPAEYKILGQSVIASVLFAANIYHYLKGNDYFGLDADQNPLLHLWSLAVEEQFYLIFPLVLYQFHRFGRAHLRWGVLAVAVASLVLANHQIATDPTAAFYLPLARFWELLAGAAVAIVSGRDPGPRWRNLAGIAGLLLILCPIFLFDSQTPFPGLWALLPVAGAVLVIMFSRGDDPVGRILSGRVMVGVGLISYSLYLWHQPVLALYRVVAVDGTSTKGYLAALAITFVLALISWRFIERPFRDREKIGRRWLFSLALIGTVGMVLFGVGGHFTSGYPGRNRLFSRLVNNYGLSPGCNGNYSVTPECANSPSPNTAIFGNSYAMHLVEGFRASQPARSLVQLTLQTCSIDPGDAKMVTGRMGCAEFVTRSLQTIIETSSISHVIISSPFDELLRSESLHAFEGVLDRLITAGKRVTIIGPTPTNGVDFGKCFVRKAGTSRLADCDFERRELPLSHLDIVQRLDSLAKRKSVGFIDLTEMICDQRRCQVSVGGALLYIDSGHLSREGSRYLFEKIVRSGSGGPGL
jgi:peptidoglycan/LPS O-acetylase OafA/YrhL